MSPQEGFPQKGILVVRADRVKPRTWGSQGHKITSNNRIDQSVNQKGVEAPKLTPHQVKDSNLGS